MQLSGAYKRVQAQIDTNKTAATIGNDGRLHLGDLEALQTSDRLAKLRSSVTARLPEVELPDLLMEVHGWTGFLDEFDHVSEHTARLNNVEVSIAAVLLAEACNVGFRPVTHETIPALTSARLSHVDQTYVRAETIRAANARLVTAQSNIAPAQRWGGGLVASVDGMRFVGFGRRTEYQRLGALYSFGNRRIMSLRKEWATASSTTADAPNQKMPNARVQFDNTALRDGNCAERTGGDHRRWVWGQCLTLERSLSRES